MSRIEELPDDFEANMKLQDDPKADSNGPSVPQPAQAASGTSTAAQTSAPAMAFPAKADDIPLDPFTALAAMPPTMSNTKKYTTDELLAELNRSPLFMTSLDDTENPALEALKALAYEGTVAEVAGNFREQGNECARAKQWTDAREYYDKALAVVKHGVPKPEVNEALKLGDNEGPPQVDWLENKPEDGQAEVKEEVDPVAEAKKEREIEEACFVNRALCNLELKNYGSCTRDCASALKINPRNIKALYRTSQALFALQKLPLAQQACTLLLSFDTTNTLGRALLDRIDKAITTAQALQAARDAQEAKARNERITLAKAIRDRGWHVSMSASAPVDTQDAALTLEDAGDASSELSVPVLLLYPTAAQTELVKGVRETETIADHLEYILPDAPWDTTREYQSVGVVECYMETREGGLVKVGRKVKLGTVLKGGKVEIKDGLCRVYVVPKPRVAGWIEEFKRRRQS